MRNLKPILIILLSIIFGLIAIAISIQWLGSQTKTKTSKVAIAAKDLLQGTQLSEDHIEFIDWPEKSLIKDPIEDKKALLTRVTKSPILRGEPIVLSKLAPIGEKGGLSALLHEGTRAVTVKVNEIVGVAGFALPGNYVDVMVNVSDRDIKPISKIVLKRILVLALAQDTATNETKPKVVNAVTLEVTPEQAEIIDLARSVGSLSLVLRSQIDKLDVNTKGSRMEDLYLSTVAPTSQTSPTSPKSTSISKKTASVALQSNSKNVEKSEVIRGVTKSME